MYASKADSLSLPLQRYGASFWTVVPRNLYDYKVCNIIYEFHGYRIAEWNHQLLSPASLGVYGDVIHAQGAALQNCFGFVDGTVRPICRPGENQRFVYNGHKRVHSLKFQSLTLPNGLIVNLYGPVGWYQHIQIFLGVLK